MNEQIGPFIGEYSWLSNFYPVGYLIYDGIRYPTVEHAYQASKTLLNEDRVWIKKSASPGIAKRRGRYLVIRQDWLRVRETVMLELLKKKFSAQNPDLRQSLLLTGESKLVEINTWHDTFWGVDAATQNGENRLGNLLEQIRGEIRMGNAKTQ